MKVYVVTSEFDGGKVIERVFLKETDAESYCSIMNMESLWDYYSYIEEEVIE